MDFLGNYFNNVNTPDKYYTKKSFSKLLKKNENHSYRKNVEYQIIPLFFAFYVKSRF